MSTEKPLDVDAPLLSERVARERENAAAYATLLRQAEVRPNWAGEIADKLYPLYPPAPPKMRTQPRTFTDSAGKRWQIRGNYWWMMYGDALCYWAAASDCLPTFLTPEDAEGFASLMRNPTEEVPE